MRILSLMFVAEAAVLIWGLVLALFRGTRSRATAPLRWLTVAYIDLFRAVPGIVLIYMIGFGIPIAGVPWVGDWSQYQLAALALRILYGAYVAEVSRAGIESIHWSQTAASRSLGSPRARPCASSCSPTPSAGSSRRCSTTSSASSGCSTASTGRRSTPASIST